MKSRYLYQNNKFLLLKYINIYYMKLIIYLKTQIKE